MPVVSATRMLTVAVFTILSTIANDVQANESSAAVVFQLYLLDAGHEGVELSQEELDKLACWIDLGIPYCGDYREANAWTSQQRASV
jgi:hypothetical protein